MTFLERQFAGSGTLKGETTVRFHSIILVLKSDRNPLSQLCLNLWNAMSLGEVRDESLIISPESRSKQPHQEGGMIHAVNADNLQPIQAQIML